MKPSRKTTTTPNHSITFTRSWWVKAVCFLFLSAFFFASCNDDLLTIGFKKEPKNFEVFYREVPVASSLFLTDSLSTYNYFVTGPTNRLLVGSYTDPKFGQVRSEFYSQIHPSNTSDTPEGDAVYDSVTLKLRLDLYNYGSGEIATLPLRVYLLAEELDNGANYINRSSVKIGSTPIAQTSVSVNPDYFSEELKQGSAADTVLVSTVIERSVGESLFELWKGGDSTFTDFEYFKKKFYGIAVVPGDGGEKIIGISPVTALTRLVLHYHLDTVKYDYDFYFDNVMGFNRIVSERSGTPLSVLVNTNADYDPINGVNYTQSGVGIFSRLDFTRLLSMRDSGDVAFNSVELEIPLSSFGDAQTPPAALGLRVIEDDNKFRPSNKLYYSQYIIPDVGQNSFGTGGQYVRSDPSSVASLSYDSTGFYRGYITQFAQYLIREDDPEKRFLKFALFPLSPDAAKSVNRFTFDPEQVKLKVYYTKALPENKGE